MTIHAPFNIMPRPAVKACSFEREVFYETLGACWALSARNISGQFAVQLHIDLTRVVLLYGTPSVHLPEHVFLDFIQTFRKRPAGLELTQQMCVEDNAWALLNGMNESDFLNFTTGFHDAVEQILEPLWWWDNACSHAAMALKYHSVQMVELGLKSAKVKRRYAQLLSHYLHNAQRQFKHESRTHPLLW